MKGIIKKSTSNTGNDGKKKVEFCPMNLRSKMKCDSSDSDPDAVIIVSPPKKVSKSKIKDKTKNKKSPPSKNTKKKPKKKEVKSMKCPVLIKKKIISPRRTTRSSMKMTKTDDVSDESTRNAHPPSKDKKSTKELKKSGKKNET